MDGHEGGFKTTRPPRGGSGPRYRFAGHEPTGLGWTLVLRVLALAVWRSRHPAQSGRRKRGFDERLIGPCRGNYGKIASNSEPLSLGGPAGRAGDESSGGKRQWARRRAKTKVAAPTRSGCRAGASGSRKGLSREQAKRAGKDRPGGQPRDSVTRGRMRAVPWVEGR